MFYGWWVVVAAAVGLCFGPAPIMVFSFGVFLKPLSEYFDANRTAISLAYTLSSLTSAAGSPIAGRLADRYGARTVVLHATAAFGGLLVASSLFSAGLWALYVFYLAVGVVSAAAAPVVYGHAVTRWFDRRRGLALGLMMGGLGLGATLMPSLAHWLVVRYSWSGAYAAFGAAVLLVALPLVYKLLKDSPDLMGLTPDGVTCAYGHSAPVPASGVLWSKARRERTFWLLIGAFVLVGGSVHACVLHLPALLTDAGVTPAHAARAGSLVGASVMLGRVLCGYLLDRLFAPAVAAAFYTLAACGMLLLRAAPIGDAWLAGTFLIGLGLGAEVDVIAFLISRHFGMRAFGEIFGYAFGAFVLAGGAGALIMGASFDATGAYGTQLVTFAIATMLAAVLISRLGPYRYLPSMAVTDTPAGRPETGNCV